MTLLRRAITVPLVTVLMIGILIVWPLLLVIGGVAGLIGRSSLPVRTLGVVMAYALLELRALWQLLRGGQRLRSVHARPPGKGLYRRTPNPQCRSAARRVPHRRRSRFHARSR